VTERARVMSVGETGPGAERTLTGRNRRTALVLVAWIIVLVLVSGVVAWLRN
jgi:hypothetical protein